MIAFIQWTTPLMLAGMGLLALPLIAHLLSRRSRKTFVVPTIRFLQEAVSQNNRMLKLKRWLLLLLRCLAVAMIVVAFARPVWFQQPAVSDPDESTAMAIVLDASMSTSQTRGGAGRVDSYQQFIAAADRSLNQLESGRDLATVVVASHTAEPLVFRLSPNFDLLKTQLNTLKWKYGRADLEGAIVEAVRQLDAHSGRKMLVIISDMQESNWRELQNLPRKLVPNNIEISFVEHENPDNANIALTNPQSLPPDPVDGQDIQLSVKLTNHSTLTRQIPVSLNAYGSPLKKNVQLEPNRSVVVSFDVNFDASGQNTFEFSIPNDALSADNRAFVATLRGSKTSIAVISDEPPEETGTSAFFLDRALRPFNNEKDRFSVAQLTSREIKSFGLSSYKIVVVGYVPGFNNEANNELIRFVAEGGSLIYLCGEGNVKQQIDAIESTAKESFFPFTLSRLDSFEHFDEAPFIASGKWRSRWLREFDLQSQIALRQIRFPKTWSINQVSNDADVVLTYDNKTPAVAIRGFGSGQIVQANLSPSIDFSEFGTYNSFVVLMQVIVRQLRGETLNEQSIVGKSILFPPPDSTLDPNLLSVVGPSGEKVNSLIAASDGKPSLMVDRSDQPGIYHLRLGEITLQSIAVNVDDRESDLRQIAPDRLALIGEGDLQVASATEFGISLVDKGTPLWGWLALVGLVAIAIESLLLGWWKQ